MREIILVLHILTALLCIAQCKQIKAIHPEDEDVMHNMLQVIKGKFEQAAQEIAKFHDGLYKSSVFNSSSTDHELNMAYIRLQISNMVKAQVALEKLFSELQEVNGEFDERLQNIEKIQLTHSEESPTAGPSTSTSPSPVTVSVPNTLGEGVYFDEQFDQNPIDNTWIHSAVKSRGYNWPAKFEWSPGKKYVNAAFEAGLSTGTHINSVYAISTKFPPFSTTNKDFVLQFSAKFEQMSFTCGGGYIKVFDCSLNPSELNSTTPHLISFGLDACSRPKLKLNLSRDGVNEETIYNGNHEQFNDGRTRVFTLVIKDDNCKSFKITENGRVVKQGEANCIFGESRGWPEVCGVGFEIYQELGGTVFYNILLTSNATFARERQKKILRLTNYYHVMLASLSRRKYS